ncbi:MAG TPA: hypothetical protein ACFYD2_04690 [Candidatus Avalokitesvara rifleensis]|uniref:hypothetical protein n=1 Tax=Candidatus Avalokitesvara rifleensis TaxID=3367620 RepID=UPI002713DF7C|nr:hypothetical protein [Candidatus Brocadiales bacterium]
MVEDIVRQIRALLQNELPAKLDQIELERADGVTLEDIQSFFIQPGHKDASIKYPNITILGEATTATNALSHRRELRHRISVWVTFREVSPDSGLAQIKLWRYMEAIERILASDPTLTGKAQNSVVIKHEYYPYHKEKDEFVSMAILDMEVLERPSISNY